ncbi:hypothetical protein CPB86DRAFT_70563 [Serendipita vermifera]|nr:hypothetical protein CPB86DRAFT_70563 [Serendipita vermifera]
MGRPIKLPPELWQMILRYSISVPVFLDPGAVENISPWIIDNRELEWNDEAEYWAAEHTINTLRSVCKSWNLYLRSYEHRFVRIVDAVHGLVAPRSLKSAIRICFTGHDVLRCVTCRSKFYFSGEEASDVPPTFPQLCWQLVRQVQPLEAQILDCIVLNFNMGGIPIPAFPKVEVFQGSWCRYFGAYLNIISSLPSLRHCFGDDIKSQGELPLFRSPNLTTLSLPFSDRVLPLDYFANQKWHLPGLRHCVIYTVRWETSEGVQSLKILIKEIGKELRSLYLPRINNSLDLSADIWSSCPKLELLHTSGVLLIPPPPDHPFHTLIISSRRFYDDIPLNIYLPNWSAIRTVRMNGKWDGALKDSKLERISPSLRIEDASGELYTDYFSRSVSLRDRGL